MMSIHQVAARVAPEAAAAVIVGLSTCAAGLRSGSNSSCLSCGTARPRRPLATTTAMWGSAATTARGGPLGLAVDGEGHQEGGRAGGEQEGEVMEARISRWGRHTPRAVWQPALALYSADHHIVFFGIQQVTWTT
jgi:hypothetical protein